MNNNIIIGNVGLTKKMNSIEQRVLEDITRAIFWMERFYLFFLLVSYELLSAQIGVHLIFTTIYVLIVFFLCPKLSSAGPSGISGFWLFLLDRFMLLLAFQSFETENIFLWRLTVFIFLANHSVYIIEYLFRTYKPHEDKIPISTELRVIDDATDDVGDVSEELEKMRELLKELREDENKMDMEMEFMEQVINSGLETHRKNLSVKLLELREELRDDGDKMRTYTKLVKHFVYSELVTLRHDLRLNVDEIWEDLRVDEDIKVSRDDLKSVAHEVLETYLVIQETTKAAKVTANRANLTYLITQEIIDEIQSIRCMIKEEDLEGFLELREEVRRMSLDFEARRMEAEIFVERTAEELSRATVELVEAVEFRPWEEFKTD